MTDKTIIYTKESLIQKLKEIRNMGWIKTTHPENAGGIGNTLEDILGIEENNLPIPNAAEWELKCQREKTSSLTTLFHMEPSPRALKFIPRILIPHYGWRHREAGKKYPETEKSFRLTISTRGRSDRGFMVKVNHEQEKVLISFDSSAVSDKHNEWLAKIIRSDSCGELSPQPYWGFDDLYHKAGAKLYNCFFVSGLHKKIDGIEYFRYSRMFMLRKFSKENFIKTIEKGDILVDFDARTGHNHGTKFRFRSNRLPELYEESTEI